MNPPPPTLRTILILSCATALTAHSAEPPLRYEFRLGETNVYRVQIELTIEGGVVDYEGAVLVIPQKIETPDDNTELLLRGSLTVRTTRTPLPMPYRPPFYAPILTLPPYTRLEVDATGRILADAGDVALPLQAGMLGAALILPLPDEPGDVIERESEVALPDDTPRPGMPWRPPHYEAPMYRQPSVASLYGSQSTRVQVGSVTGQSAQVTWTTKLRSWLEFGLEPRVAADAEGAATLDRERGLLREIQFTHRETTTSETVTRRSKLAFKALLLEGEEREDALLLHRPRTAEALTVAEVEAALEDLESSDDRRRSEAVQRLQSDNLETLPPEVAARAEALLDTRDESARWAAARILARAATSDQVPAVLRLMRQPDSPARQPAIEALARLRDRRGIEPLVGFIARGENERYAAIEALKQFGIEAEESVLRLFTEKNLETQRAACQILAVVGTSRSLDTLRAAMLDPDRQLRDLASQAVGAIVARER